MTARASTRAVAAAYAALWALTLTAATIALLAGVAAQVTPDGQRGGNVSETLSILTTNARMAAVTIAAALLLRIVREWRLIFDLVLGVLYAFNAAVVGVAIAEHGPAILPWLAHLPIEWAAFAISAGAYLQARNAPPSWSLLARYAALAAVTLTLAAVIESYALPL
ncbi:hypothetical protein C8N24_0310 [Solirubrobacter pauli]|uniref:Uncharacterized protein n=1 Tax=Solirubrobacter pauli TaxID=166793 RepID=A0A660L8B7_9ACTN|nr:hypothetical protein [Solirubrobacter pauli]RKQ90505.1 hypothetical protein C8N24_0310 [Solirubrobacter pauli]